MAPDAAALLTALQFADSAFPAGGFAFSWGLEGLAADGMVADADDVRALAAEHLALRWQGLDRPLLRAAFAAEDVDATIAVDRLAEAATLPAALRAGTRRAGRALLGSAARLGLAAAQAYRDATRADARLGHLAVAQGVVFRAAGLELPQAEALGGWGVITALTGAAIRLGLIGHVEAQHIATAARPTLARLLQREPPGLDGLASFTPLTDIAVMRGAGRHLRMFAT